MEPLRLLQFWHIPSDKNTAACGDSDSDTTSSPSETTTTTNDKDHHSVATDDEDSFFDLDFTVPLKKKPKDFNPNDKVSARKALPKARVRLHMLLKNAEESENKTEASKEVPIFSLLDIGNSPARKFQKQRSENATRRFPKVVIQKYLKLINPFYSRASKKEHTQTVKSANQVSKKTTPFSSPRKQVVEKQRIRVAREHLGRSHSAAASRVRSVPARRDDSLLLQHDGIQSAILHCKRSYNSSAEFSVLSRSASGPGPYPSEKASVLIPSRNSTEEVKTRTSI
ncbi:hypothetical protein RHSIM_Rhsim09G0202200 [Rhododendron simsii]|uniref:Membrane-associated kinase regulator 2 n=1 Tax=Rhododendron simsii TaxID=118357 RepID=A0A834GDJ0_RHOSS|nr:hypothetical protein RHSIM_Rhsim09G0202200 [Rhododendron simsii]